MRRLSAAAFLCVGIASMGCGKKFDPNEKPSCAEMAVHWAGVSGAPDAKTNQETCKQAKYTKKQRECMMTTATQADIQACFK